MLFVLVSIGINDFSMKVFKASRPETDEPFFVFVIFLFAFIYSSLFILLKKIRINKKGKKKTNVILEPKVFEDKENYQYQR